jgi:hypothetical protein
MTVVDVHDNAPAERQVQHTQHIRLIDAAIQRGTREPNLARSKQTCGSKCVFDISSERSCEPQR